MNIKNNICITLLVLGSLIVKAQTGEEILSESQEKNAFSNKFYWGISGNQYWGNIKGNNLPREYFGKPCLGFNLRVEYYPLSYIGIGLGVGIQQRGAGIINDDKSGGSFTHPWDYPQFNGDSTYRQRLRFNTFEVPLTILVRTPNDLVRGVRPSIAVGISYVKTQRVNDVFLSVEDGYHLDQIVTRDYLSNDLAMQFSAGADIDAGGGCILQFHLVYTKGTKNVYAANQGDGRLETYGFRLAWLYSKKK